MDQKEELMPPEIEAVDKEYPDIIKVSPIIILLFLIVALGFLGLIVAASYQYFNPDPPVVATVTDRFETNNGLFRIRTDDEEHPVLAVQEVDYYQLEIGQKYEFTCRYQGNGLLLLVLNYTPAGE